MGKGGLKEGGGETGENVEGGGLRGGGGGGDRHRKEAYEKEEAGKETTDIFYYWFRYPIVRSLISVSHIRYLIFGQKPVQRGKEMPGETFIEAQSW
jgi:hypothetical protein